MRTRTILAPLLVAHVVAGCLVVPVRGTPDTAPRSVTPAPMDSDFRLSLNQGQARDLWPLIRDRFALPDVLSGEVAERERWLLAHRAYVSTMLERARLFLPHIAAAVAARGAPMEIALLPAVESGFKPLVRSPSGAAGLWQFMPATARDHDLAMTPDYDARLDVVASTRAALDYLDQLVERFDGDWLLALSAYNAGPGTVLDAVETNRRAGRPTSVEHLALRAQTRRYVPKLLALRNLLRDPARFGIELPPLADRPTFVAIEASPGIALPALAGASGTRLAELRRLNPAMLRDAVPQSTGTVPVLVPPQSAPRLRAALDTLPPAVATDTVYRVAAGDTIASIARRHGVDPVGLAAHNDLDDDFLAVNQVLRVPRPAATGTATRLGSLSE
jgi:membrane-bound lytic murein transglycosylase D